MTENAKGSAEMDAEQKGRAEQEQTEQPKEKDEQEKVTTKVVAESEDLVAEAKITTDKDAEPVEAKLTIEEEKEKTSEDKAEESKAENAKEDGIDKKAEDEADKANIEISIELPEEEKKTKEDFQSSIREQIENCKFEIISSLQDSVHNEMRVAERQIRKVERRRKCGVIVRDIIILILAVIVGYFGYCLYDAKYFNFMKSDCEREGNCAITNSDGQDEQKEAEIVKDTDWYRKNYGYLYDSLKINLNADKVSAYYLYSDDYKVGEIQPSYLLAMAYNRLNSNITYDSDRGIMIPADDLRNSFVNLFGSADYFARKNFTYDCAEFNYDKDVDSFVTPSVQCNSTSNRQIVEEIDEIFEEGNAMYFLTTATIYDKAEGAFYNFDNLFKPVAKSVEKEDFEKHKASLNQYQYKFKKVDGKYYFSDVVKLK